jgi:pyruvate,orthophosphate dikinase
MDFCFLDSADAPGADMVGGKGFYLCDMARMGLPVPPAALLTTELWARYQEDPFKVVRQLKKDIIPQVVEYLKAENGGVMPLVSVRSAGAVSMPGMMDTILNVGAGPKFMGGSEAGSMSAGELKFAIDVYARFLSMYGHTVLNIDKKALGEGKQFKTMAAVTTFYKAAYKKHEKELPAAKIEDQLLKCVLAVFDSWNNERAKLYRQINGIDENAGTAVVIQRMVYGNKSDASATGVVFSRNPSNGDPALVGEYLVEAQGEDVVSGSHTPLELSLLEEDFPQAYEDIKRITRELETHYQQVQDIEFTIEDEQLFLLQARTAKCSPFAKLRMLMDLHRGRDANAQAVLDGLSLAEYLELNVRQVDPGYAVLPDGEGLPASMGALCGRVVFGPSQKYQGDPTIFVARQTTPDDLQAIHMATGILTASGGVTSHAAVVARGMGKVCVVGCEQLVVQTEFGEESARIGGKKVVSGDWITLDAHRGRVWIGKEVPIIDAQNTQLFWDFEDLVFEANPEWTRVTSKVDEVAPGRNTLLLSYDLDSVDEDVLCEELLEATRYLTGSLDLTG